MATLRSCFSGVRLRLVALIPVAAVVAVAFAASPATAGAAGASADLATTIGNVEVFFSSASFTVTVTNNGPSTAQNVTVTDNWTGGGGFWLFAGLQVKAPAGVSCTTPPVGKPLAPRVVTCSASSLGSGQSIVLQLALRPELFTGRGAVTDSATAASATPDPDSANNMASFWTTTV